MSFEALKENTPENKELLQKIADEFGVEVRANAKAETIVAALEADGVDWESASKFVADAAVKSEEFKEKDEERKANGPQELLKMTRANFSYEVRGVRFSKEHPFAIVNEEDAAWIVENEEGFRYATPREAQEFYS